MMSQSLLLGLRHFIIELFRKVRLASGAGPCIVQVACLHGAIVAFMVCRGAREFLWWNMSLAI